MVPNTLTFPPGSFLEFEFWAPVSPRIVVIRATGMTNSIIQYFSQTISIPITTINPTVVFFPLFFDELHYINVSTLDPAALYSLTFVSVYIRSGNSITAERIACLGYGKFSRSTPLIINNSSIYTYNELRGQLINYQPAPAAGAPLSLTAANNRFSKILGFSCHFIAGATVASRYLQFNTANLAGLIQRAHGFDTAVSANQTYNIFGSASNSEDVRAGTSIFINLGDLNLIPGEIFSVTFENLKVTDHFTNCVIYVEENILN